MLARKVKFPPNRCHRRVEDLGLRHFEDARPNLHSTMLLILKHAAEEQGDEFDPDEEDEEGEGGGNKGLLENRRAASAGGVTQEDNTPGSAPARLVMTPGAMSSRDGMSSRGGSERGGQAGIGTT